MSVTLENVGHAFHNGEWVFRGLTTELRGGSVVGLIGPSGSGKSTLLSIIAGITHPSEGRVLGLNGRACWVLQNPHGVPRRTALDHVSLALLGNGQDTLVADEAAMGLLVRFGLGGIADREFRALSGGEAQRLMLARAVASKPKLLLVDEPTAQLDRATATSVNEAIVELASPGLVVVVATHDERTREACTNFVDLGAYSAADLQDGL